MKSNKLLVTIFLISIFSLILLQNLSAYCVYNKTDTTIKAEQVSGGKGWPRSFNKNIDPGEKACCNWKTKDCNTEGRRDSIVGFDISYLATGGNNGAGFVSICRGFKIKAGGDLIVKGNKGNYRCIAVGY